MVVTGAFATSPVGAVTAEVVRYDSAKGRHDPALDNVRSKAQGTFGAAYFTTVGNASAWHRNTTLVRPIDRLDALGYEKHFKVL